MFSKGFHSSVYDIATKKDALLWGTRADLVRVEHSKTRHRLDAKILFYSHLIARLLFPENTINVTGGRTEGSFTRLYSKLATVPSEHALYSMHTVRKPGPKISDCQCDTCTQHRKFHEDNRLQEKAKETSTKMKECGIWVPKKDPTDYCMSPSGNIIFFEQDLDPYAAKRSILSDGEPSTRDRLLKLIERYHTLFTQRQTSRRTVHLNTDHSLTQPQFPGL